MVSFGGADDIADLVVVAGGIKREMTSFLVDYQKSNIRDFVIKEAYGNPFSETGNLHIKIDLKELKEVSILLQDEFGQNVMLDFENLIIGENDIEIPASTVSFLHVGKIYYTVFTDEQVQTGALIKM